MKSTRLLNFLHTLLSIDIYSPFRAKILQVTDERIKIMSETIKSMSIVKMYCWESAFSKKVRSVRT